MFFFKHRRTDKKFRRFLKGRTIYFSIRPTRAGFSDQLLRFTAIYRIGKYLGLRYFHIPFQPKPLIIETDQEAGNSSGKPTKLKDYSIYDFIGLNTHFNSTNPGFNADEMETITINLEKSELTKNGINNSFQFICFLEEIILQSLEGSLKKVVLVKFNISNEIPALFRISSGIPNKTGDIDFKQIYFKNRETNPQKLRFDSDKIRCLMHIRQGDTAVIKTPWNTFIQVWKRKENAFNEFDAIHQINDISIITVDDYYSFYKNLAQVFDPNQLSTLLFSDGFARSFFILFDKTEKLNFTQHQVEQLHQWALTYNHQAFKAFEELLEQNMFIGEDTEKLYDLVHSFLNSDIVIFGTQQRMIPKLYALYFCKNDGPLCIVLYRKKMVSYDYLGNNQMSENFVFVDLDNYEIAEIHSRIMKFVEERKKNKA
jgi:hypothetical protein